MHISKIEFGKVNDKVVYLYSIENDNGIKTSITNYGGIMTTLFVPDRNGKSEDVILGFNNLDSYLQGHPYFGALVGRYANRIAKGNFTIDIQSYKLAINNGPNHLHGGITGFDKVIWNANEFKTSDEIGIRLSYVSKDMEEGYPGNLSVEVIYSLNNNNELKIEYSATTDKKTHVNLTQHNYYNLNACKSDVKDHLLTLSAKKYTPKDDDSIPTGKLEDVSGTPFDFLKSKKIGKDLEKIDGYDHNFVIENTERSLKFIAKAEEDISGRVMEVFTTQPGVQLYTANFLDGSLIGKDNVVYKKYLGFCLETQHFPNSPNQPNFPSTLLKPGERYHEITVYKFSTKSL